VPFSTSPPGHVGRGAGVDLVEQRRAEEVAAVDGCGEEAGPGIERPLFIMICVGQVGASAAPSLFLYLIHRPADAEAVKNCRQQDDQSDERPKLVFV